MKLNKLLLIPTTLVATMPVIAISGCSKVSSTDEDAIKSWNHYIRTDKAVCQIECSKPIADVEEWVYTSGKHEWIHADGWFVYGNLATRVMWTVGAISSPTFSFNGRIRTTDNCIYSFIIAATGDKKSITHFELNKQK